MKNLMKKKPVQRFTPTAWAKLLFMRDMSDNEVGGFGITGKDDLLLITDFAIVKQNVSIASVSFADDSVADFFDTQVELGRKPEQFARIWLHTHPGNSPDPSTTDESTFARVFGQCDWSVMCIVARNDDAFARLRFNTGPGGDVKIPVCVDYGCEFEASDFNLWEKQYRANVSKEDFFKLTDSVATCVSKSHEVFGGQDFSILDNEDLFAEFDRMGPQEREEFIEELTIRNEFWDKESEVLYE